MSTYQWGLRDVPDLTGRRALVTGVTSGLGEQTVLELARAGAEVVLAARDEEKLGATIEHVRRTLPDASLVPLVVDLADLDSVRRAAARAVALGPLDLLVNNAGVMATPQRRTVDGFDLQMGTNHFGHFALTGLLMPALTAAEHPRVVTVSSLMHRLARTVPLDDPRVADRRYRKWEVYSQSKLANLLFALELDRRASAAGLPLTSVAAHPGYAATNLQAHGPGMGGRRADGWLLLGVTRVVGQPASMGAMPTLMAATLDGLPGGSFVGPRGPFEARGMPTLVKPSRAARRTDLAAALWELSERATGVTYP